MPAQYDLGSRILQYSAAKSAMDAAKDYLDRGRRYASLSDGDLRNAFIARFREWARNVAQDILAQGGELNDLNSELELRKQAPPYEELQSELALVQRVTLRHAASLTEDERQQLVGDMVEQYRRDLDRRQ